MITSQFLKFLTLNPHLHPKRWGLSAKLSAAYSLLILLVAGALTTNLYLLLKTNQRQAMRDRLLDLVSLAAPQIDSDYHSLIVTASDTKSPYYKIISEQIQKFQSATQGIDRIYTLRPTIDGKIVYVIYYSAQGKTKVEVGQTLPKLTPLLKLGINKISSPVVENQLAKNAEGKTVLYGYAPIIDTMGRREGLLAIELDASTVIESEIQARNLAIMTFLITLPLAISIGWWLAKRLTAPISQLVIGAQEMATGNFNYTVKVLSQDEIGTLADAFNVMGQKLQESFESLEIKVAQRTQALAKANEEINSLNERLKAENFRMGAELDIAKQLQQMVLPRESELESIEGLEIAGFMEPADEVGGDYYDVLRQGEGVKISIGDVTGHGLESGVLMIMAQTAVRTLEKMKETDPVKFLDVVNQTLYDNLQRMNSGKNMSLAILDYAKGVLTLSGQHEEMIVVRADRKLECIDTMELGFPIGLEAQIGDFIAQEEVALNCGDVVVLYTDGITEAENINKEFYGLERLCDVVVKNRHNSAEEIKEIVIDDVRQHIGSQKVFDDITLVVMKQK
jgi:serine phosphatase RsbU (regulator of sigma subunit)